MVIIKKIHQVNSQVAKARLRMLFLVVKFEAHLEKIWGKGRDTLKSQKAIIVEISQNFGGADNLDFKSVS